MRFRKKDIVKGTVAAIAAASLISGCTNIPESRYDLNGDGKGDYGKGDMNRDDVPDFSFSPENGRISFSRMRVGYDEGDLGELLGIIAEEHNLEKEEEVQVAFADFTWDDNGNDEGYETRDKKGVDKIYEAIYLVPSPSKPGGKDLYVLFLNQMGEDGETFIRKEKLATFKNGAEMYVDQKDTHDGTSLDMYGERGIYSKERLLVLSNEEG